jgi:hypothetical protein
VGLCARRELPARGLALRLILSLHLTPETYMPKTDERTVSCNLKLNTSTCFKENTVYLIPKEFTIGGIYFPPLLIAGILGVVAAILTAMLLNRFRLSRFFFYPPLVFVALAIIYTVMIGTFIIPV